MSSADRRIPATIWWLLLAWGAVTAAAVVWALPHEEEDLEERAQAALSDTAIAVDFLGRDARLTGQVGDSADLDRAVATIRQVRGVRRVDSSEVTVDPTPTVAPNPPTPPLISVETGRDAISLSGTLPDQETVDAILQAARTQWGDEAVVDQLGVGANTAGAAWLAGIVPAINAIDTLSAGSLSADVAGVLLAGVAPSVADAAAVEAAVRAGFTESVPVEIRIEVVVPDDPSFEAELLDDGSVRLRGLMPDQESIDSIVAGASGVFGSANVVNEMTVGSQVSAPGYLGTLPATFGAIEGLRPWRVNVEGGRAIISGRGISEEAIAASVEALAIAFGFRGLELTSELEVDSGAVATVLTELLQGTATFEIGSSQLSADATRLLDEAIEILQANPATVLTVEGHTDDVGGEDDNLVLSEERAQAVVDYLIAGGVDAMRLEAVGYGESRPIADNTTAAGRAENRRIQFVVEEGDG